MPKSNPPVGDNLTFERSSGNVFADIGLANADELLVKADLAHAIRSGIRSRRWTLEEAAARTGLSESDVLRIGRMKADSFSEKRMQCVLLRIEMDVRDRDLSPRNGRCQQVLKLA
jgi:predicted XRE-type DNA-binding protein